MKPTPDREQLLDDVLNEDAEIRASSLETLLLAARRRQHARRRNRVLLMTSLAVSGIIAGVWSTHRSTPIAVAPSVPSATHSLVIESAPLPAGMWVQSTRSSVEIIASSTDSISILETPRGTSPLHEINDGELFALLAGRAAAIVRPPTGPAELLVLEQ